MSWKLFLTQPLESVNQFLVKFVSQTCIDREINDTTSKIESNSGYIHELPVRAKKKTQEDKQKQVINRIKSCKTAGWVKVIFSFYEQKVKTLKYLYPCPVSVLGSQTKGKCQKARK